MKNTYYVITHELNGKHYAESQKVGAGENILCYIKNCRTMKTLTVCESKKEAEYLTSLWNQGFKDNKTYALICNNKIY